MVGELCDAFAGLGVCDFVLAVVTDTDLHQAAYLGQRGHHIIHNRCVRIFESFVSNTQVAVSVDMEYSEVAVFLGQCLYETIRRAMVATHQADKFILVEQGFGLCIDLFVQLFATRIYLVEFAA